MTFTDRENEFGIVGMPLLESNANYECACLHGSELSIETWVDEWAGKTFVVQHRIAQEGGRLAVSGFERRIFVVAAPDEPSGMRGIAPPDEILARLREDA